jgi:hypothetical protein
MLSAEILAELREQTRWLRFRALRALGPILETALRNDRERLAYELSDGRPSKAIGDAVGVRGQSILKWWARWLAAGIAVEQKGGRVVRLASLTQLGIPVPTVAAQRAKSVGRRDGQNTIAEESGT